LPDVLVYGRCRGCVNNGSIAMLLALAEWMLFLRSVAHFQGFPESIDHRNERPHEPRLVQRARPLNGQDEQGSVSFALARHLSSP
jgi:hypothetical protein